MAQRFSVALVHHPVLHKDGTIIASAVTNTDLHDIARSCTTYGAAALYIVTPVLAQQALVTRLIHHWTAGRGAQRNADRATAFACMRVVASVEDALAAERVHCPQGLEAWSSSARHAPGALGFAQARQRLTQGAGAMLLLGTAHGLAQSALDLCSVRLAPLPGVPNATGATYNHLSVRAAAAIMLYELLGHRAA